jgi:hypothetical protein
MFIPLEEEGAEGKEEDLQAWNCRLFKLLMTTITHCSIIYLFTVKERGGRRGRVPKVGIAALFK